MLRTVAGHVLQSMSCVLRSLALGTAGVVHDARNMSGAPVKLVGVYIVEKGKPLASPAP